jgi:predicted RNase H-like HicB family nuclease
MSSSASEPNSRQSASSVTVTDEFLIVDLADGRTLSVSLTAVPDLYSPDVPGCVSTGRTREEVEVNMREAIALHLDGLREDGKPLPPPHTIASYVEVAA